MFNHSPVGEHASCGLSPPFSYCELVLLSTFRCKFLFESIFNSFEYVPRGRVAGSYSNLMFTFWRNHQKVFHSACIIYHSHLLKHRCSNPNFSTSLLLLSLFLVTAIPTGKKWYLTAILICL